MKDWKGINIKVIIKVIGFLLVIEGFFMLGSLPFSIYYAESEGLAILYSALITIGTGAILSISTRKHPKSIGRKEGYVIVAITWIIISLFGTLPFLFSGSISNFTDAFFETMSGFTTTGATILTDIESMPKSLLFWRSMTHWIGGMGIIVFTVAILPILGIGGMQLYSAEMPGVTKDKLHPRITETAKRLWAIYLIFTVLETVLLMFGGMSLFNALCHTFGTVATGGFSTQNESIAAFSPYVQYVIIAFMILAGTNFTLHYFAMHGQLRKVWRNEEYRYYIMAILIGTVVISLVLAFGQEGVGFEKALRTALFQVTSIITTTGYITDNYLLWPHMIWFLVVLMMFIGGMAGSTGGGIKVVRQLLLLKNSLLELKRLIHPQAIIPVRMNGKVVSQDIIFKVMAFFLIYIIIFIIGSTVMALIGLDGPTAIGATAATLGNIGPGLGNVGPVDHYGFIPAGGKWFLSFLMLLGRLELFTVLILFSPVFWKK
ncbi:MAG: potassium transporter TrkG [Bacteroidales bacterium]|jgi:trk system potassium uptake protein TrkH|nr:potassium transporter TrkG [Bacteroidales bacterium]